jgi:hypothetical protein
MITSILVMVIGLIPAIIALMLEWLPASWNWPTAFTDGLTSFFVTLYKYDVIGIMPTIADCIHLFTWFMLLAMPVYIILRWMGYIRGSDKLT